VIPAGLGKENPELTIPGPHQGVLPFSCRLMMALIPDSENL